MFAAFLALAAATADPASAFAQMKTMVGAWRNAERPNSPLRVEFSLTANGTVLVEEWRRGRDPHSLTLYHRDGADLIATHYCPQGNQPRLKMVRDGKPGIRFAFKDVTDLSETESHQHSLAFDLTNPARPVRSETYRTANGADEPSQLVLTRVEGADAAR